MKLLVAVLGLSLASWPALAAGRPEPQPLAIRVQADTVEATHLPSYDPNAPIAVIVTAARKRSDELSVVASGPAGASLRAPLTRDANGAFVGTLALNDPGSWRLQLASRQGTLRAVTSPVMLDVEPPPPSNAGQIGWAVGGAIFIAFGGGGFLLLRRLAPVRTGISIEPARIPAAAAAAAKSNPAVKHPVAAGTAIRYET